MPDASLVFTAQANSNKIKDIDENPQVAATVLLMYINNGQNVSRQVRFVGAAEKLPQDQCKIYFEKETLSAKIRSWICQECGTTDWDELKIKHDELLKEIKEEGRVLEMPDTQVAYRIVPCEMDFYSSDNYKIADRILFKNGESGQWSHERLMP